MESFKDVDAKLIAVDPHEAWSAKYLLQEAGITEDKVTFPVLLDPAFTVSATYGVAFQMRIHVERSNRPATFIIDKEGVIRYSRRGRKFNDRPTPADILAELKKLK